jgi:hypothetical protein
MGTAVRSPFAEVSRSCIAILWSTGWLSTRHAFQAGAQALNAPFTNSQVSI